MLEIFLSQFNKKMTDISYLVFLDPEYGNDKKLRRLKHNFKKIFNEINKNEDNVTVREIRKKLDEYDLCKNNFTFTEMRYPQLSSSSTYPYLIYYGGENVFKNIFRRIEHEVAMNKKNNTK
jgi:hypothetical protein